jgi:hypothetical protein
VDRGTTTVNGKTTVHQFLSSSATGLTGRNWYISSPLSAASSNTITTATGNGLVKYNNGWENAGTTMDVMTGYIAKSPAQNTTISFSGGTLNTGNKLISNLPLGYNLVGNPYPSYVNWTDAIKTNISTSIWYRSKSTGSYLFQTYNVAGDGVSVNGGTDIIPPMQSFWIKTTNATNSLGFTNNMRSHQDQSIVSNRLKAPKVSNQQLLRLEVSNGIFRDEAVIYFNENAQNTLDDYDSQKMFNNITEVPEIYTQIGVDNLVINGMNKIPYDTEIPLGFSTLQSNNFTISATEIKNFEAGTHIILKDKLNPDSEIELNNATIYDFYSEASNRIDRFSLIFRTPGTTTRLKNTSKLNVQVFVNRENQIMIIAPEKCKFTIYNSVGQIVNNGITSTNCTTINLKLLKGMYVLRLQDKGKELITKVIIK